MPDPDTHPGNRHEKYARLVEKAQRLPPMAAIVAHPCDDVSLGGAVEAAKLRLIEPILVGPADRIRRVAEDNRLDISALELVDA
ncbi:MAG: phosphate acetyltransferase, partial [Acetobacteraceae bacterium]|nr:phosphate acetyltransferase [Acetobacteraceae bacterium]